MANTEIKFRTYSIIDHQADSLLKSFVVNCVRVEVLVAEPFLVCPNFSEVESLGRPIAEAFIADLLQVWIPDCHHCVFFNFLINGFAFDIVNTHTKEIPLRVNGQEGSRDVLLFGQLSQDLRREHFVRVILLLQILD